jgi:hypothetical protein
MKVKFDVAALRAAADREDSDLAIVARRWLRDVLLIVTGEAEVELIQPGDAPTPMLPA